MDLFSLGIRFAIVAVVLVGIMSLATILENDNKASRAVEDFSAIANGVRGAYAENPSAFSSLSCINTVCTPLIGQVPDDIVDNSGNLQNSPFGMLWAIFASDQDTLGVAAFGAPSSACINTTMQIVGYEKITIDGDSYSQNGSVSGAPEPTPSAVATSCKRYGDYFQMIVYYRLSGG
ncbi:hypothetical protein [Acidocella facilis]|uniref:hypothetical protein n=1 Tax=Acidocella facilis TaxID=525 RepID=UPI001F38BDE4|nr:hypothetical protein [Acidocella facilis]